MAKIEKQGEQKPVSKDLDEAAEEYTKDDTLKPWRNLCKEAFKAGARWKEQTMEESIVLYKRAFDFYGMAKNSGFLMEECGELMSAVNKLQRNRTNKEAVIEELADVYQVLMAFVMHFGYDKFSLMLDQKKKKLEERLH